MTKVGDKIETEEEIVRRGDGISIVKVKATQNDGSKGTYYYYTQRRHQDMVKTEKEILWNVDYDRRSKWMNEKEFAEFMKLFGQPQSPSK